MTPKIITPPTAEPIITEDAKAHLRVGLDQQDEDFMVDTMLGAAREWCEQYTGLALATQTLEIALDATPLDGGPIEMPMSPVQSIVSITYADANGAEKTVSPSGLSVDTYSFPNWLSPAAGTKWPATGQFINAVRIRYIAGFTEETLPKSIRHAILLVLGHLYENRQNVTDAKSLQTVPMGAEALLAPYRYRWVLS